MANEVFLYVSDIKDIENQNDMILYCGYDFLMNHDEIVEPLVIEKNENGKPDFIKNIHFNISHSKDLWICAISYEEIGVDCEKIIEKDYEKIVKRFLNQAVTDINDFYRIWCAKEAYSKLTSLGLSDFSNFTIDNHNVIKNEKTIANINYPKYKKDYQIAVCSYQRANIKLIEL